MSKIGPKEAQRRALGEAKARARAAGLVRSPDLDRLLSSKRSAGKDGGRVPVGTDRAVKAGHRARTAVGKREPAPPVQSDEVRGPGRPAGPPRKMLSIGLPPELVARIDAWREGAGTRTEAIVALLKRGLEK